MRSSQPSRIFSVTGTRDRADGGLDQVERMIEVAHQRRAGLPVGDLLGRAAHVDVDDLGARASAMRAPSAIQCGSQPAS